MPKRVKQLLLSQGCYIRIKRVILSFFYKIKLVKSYFCWCYADNLRITVNGTKTDAAVMLLYLLQRFGRAFPTDQVEQTFCSPRMEKADRLRLVRKR